MDIILEQYRTRLVRLEREPGTLIAFDKAARKFQAHLDATSRAAADLKAWDIEAYLGDLPLALSTKRTHMIHLGGAYRYAHRRGMLPADPTIDVMLPKPPDKEPVVIPNDELRRFRGLTVHDRHWLEFHLLAYTGMRQGEIRSLRWDDVILGESTIRVLGKGGKLRYVPIHPALGEALADARPATDCHVVTTTCRAPVSYPTWQLDLRTFSPGYTAHAYRRTVSTSLARNGVDERVIDRILGWAPTTVRSRYYVNVATEELQRGILKLYANDPV